MSTVIVEKSSKGFAFASATWHFSTEQLPEEAPRTCRDHAQLLQAQQRRRRVGARALTEGAVLAPGDQVEVHLSIRAKHAPSTSTSATARRGFEPEKLASAGLGLESRL